MAEPKTPTGPASVEKKYYGVFDAEGRPTAFYISDIFLPQANGSPNAAIPATAVEITEEQWHTLVTDPATSRYVDGQVIHVVPPPPIVPAAENPTLAEAQRANARVKKLRTLMDTMQARIEALEATQATP